MPVFNGAATLEASLTSLTGQGDGIEVVLVDQGSADDSLLIAERFRDRMDIRVIEAPDNKSWMQNTNLAIENARAPLITMLHQDDVWMEGRGAALRTVADRYPDAGLWAHAAFYIDAVGRCIGRIGPPFGPTLRLVSSSEALSPLLVQNTLALPAVMFRREDAQRAGGLDEDLWYTADWDFWLRLAATAPILWMPEPLVGFRLHRGSLTVTGSRDAEEFRRQLAIPPQRHLSALEVGDVQRVARLGAASNAINVWLANSYHGDASGMACVLGQVWALGPFGWRRLLRDAQLIRRIVPRLKLKFGK